MAMFEQDESDYREALCQRVLGHFGPQVVPLRTTDLGNSGGFSGAGIWRVVTEFGDFALRRWPNPALPEARIRGLHRLLVHLRREGLSCVSVPLPAREGTTVVNERGHLWQLEPWLPGTADFSSQPRSERLRAAMQTLAQWHLAAERYHSDVESAEWFACHPRQSSPAVRERLQILDRLERRIAVMEAAISGSPSSPIRDLAHRILHFVRHGRGMVAARLEAVRDREFRLHPCLRDVWHDHLLFTEDKVTGVIDPSACRSDHVACDLSRLIGSLVRNDVDQWDLALAEYQRYRPLTVVELQLVDALDRSGVLLSGWTWLEWIYAERRKFADLNGVQQRMNLILQRMEHLIDGNGAKQFFVLP